MWFFFYNVCILFWTQHLKREGVTLPLTVLQELQGADAAAGRESAGLQRCLQGETAEEKRAQTEDHSSGSRGHRAGSAEQRANGAVAQGNPSESLAEGGWRFCVNRSIFPSSGNSGDQSQVGRKLWAPALDVRLPETHLHKGGFIWNRSEFFPKL